MIYDESEFVHNTYIEEGASSDLNQSLTAIYNMYKREVEAEQKKSAACFKSGDYSKAKTHCKNTIKLCNNMIQEINKLDTNKLNGVGRIKRSRYIKWAIFMSDDAKIAIKQADEEIKRQKKK